MREGNKLLLLAGRTIPELGKYCIDFWEVYISGGYCLTRGRQILLYVCVSLRVYIHMRARV